MVVTVEYENHNLDVRVTYYGPQNTYTIVVRSDFESGYDIPPPYYEVEDAINSLVWYSAQDGGHFRLNNDDTYSWIGL